MTKKLKIYQILTFVLGLAFVGLCLFVGITAIQKQMKLNLAVKMNPSIVCEIHASMDGANGTYNKIFSNVEGSTSIGTNWSISGNTLSYNTSLTDMGKEIYLKVTNKTTGTRVMVEYNNEVKDVVEVNGTSTTPFSVSIPGNGKVQILFSQVFKVTTTLTNASVTATTNLYEIGGTYYAKTGTTPTMTLTSDTHYTNPPSSVTVTGATKDYNTTTGVLTLSNITGDVTVTASASAATYTVLSNLSGISSNTIANEATYNTDYTFTLTVASTSWTMGAVTYTVGGGSAQTLSGTTTDNLTYTYTIPGNEITGAIVINATATSSYSIYATINGEDVLIGEYSQKSTEQPITINYPSTFTGTGDLMSAVTGVSEVTATQITISANTTGPITIVPKGYWIGTYTSTYPNETVYDYDTKANIKVGTVWAGYKFLQFNGATDYGSYPMRWIIIGGDSANSTSTYGAGANKEYDTFSAKQVLLLSEKTLVSKQFGSSAAWTGSTLQTWLNTQDTSGNFLTDSKMQSYYDNIATVTLQTAWSPNSNEDSTVLVELRDQKIFLLASKHGYNKQATNLKDTNGNYTYQNQNYMVEEYLGDETTYPGLGYTNDNSTSCLKMFAFSGSNTSQTSCWWLRSGGYSLKNYPCRVYFIGYLSGSGANDSYGVRPSFVFNLA